MFKKIALAGALLCACAPAHAGGYYDDLFNPRPSARIAKSHAIPRPPPHPRFRSRTMVAARPDSASFDLHPLLQVAQRYLGRGNFTGFHEAWCADAVNAWLRQAGFAPQASHRAVDFAHYGRPTAPHVGAIAVMHHHVGIVAGFARGGVLLVSGNHGGRVGRGVYSFRRIIAFREAV